MNRVLLALVGFAALSLTAGMPASDQVELRDLNGRSVRPLNSQAKATVFVFVRSDCPISNRYAPELQRLSEKYRNRGVNFWLIYPGRTVLPETIREHLREYAYSLPALQDPEHRLVKLTGVHVTPEVAVYSRAGEKLSLVYHGRIDDRVADFGKARQAASKHDLEETLECILNGRPVTTSVTPAVGCFIADLE